MKQPTSLRELEMFETFRQQTGLRGQALRDAWTKEPDTFRNSPKGSPSNPDNDAWNRRFVGGYSDHTAEDNRAYLVGIANAFWAKKFGRQGRQS